MEKLKKGLLKLLRPYPAFAFVFVPVAAGLLIYVFVSERSDEPVAYLAYFLSAYAMALVCARLPGLFGRIRAVKRENEYLSRYFSDAALRVKISLYGTLSVNTLYAVMQLGMGIYNHSVWFYALSGYYFMLALMRFFLLRQSRRSELGADLHLEYLDYRRCGVLLLLMNLALAVIATYIVKQNRGFSYHNIVTIAMAAYTFFSFTTAIVNLFRYRKYNSPVMSAAKAISFAAALVSMLSLETAMLAAFGGEEDPAFRMTITAVTAFAVCAAVLIMAIYMIAHAAKQLHKEDAENER